MLAGVCGGVAAYFGVDATMVRVAVIVLGIVTGVLPFVIAYILCAVVMPAEGAGQGPTPPPPPANDAPLDQS
jgi:phage shock protein PspC (stress-responsive transcriptional regulator)